ncbi:MAG: PAS domain S-box protein [Candidatus Sericytochromatia bacterium]
MDSTPSAPSELLWQLLGALDECTWAFDPTRSRYLWLSPALEVLLGWPLADLQAEPIWPRGLHPDDLAWVQASRLSPTEAWEQVLEYRIITAQGQTKWVRDSQKCRLSPEGPMLVGVLVEITSEKKAQHALQTELARWQALFENTNEAVCLVSPAGQILFATAGMARISGYQPEERQQRSIVENIHPDDLKNSLDLLQRVQAQSGAQERLELRVRHKEGGWKWIEGVVKNRLEDPEIGALVVNFRSIDVRKQAEARLRQQEMRFTQLVNHLQEGVLLSRSDGRILMANTSALEMFGYSLEEMQQGGRHLLFRADDPELEAGLKERELTGSTLRLLAGHRKDQSVFVCEVSSVRFEDSQGERLNSVLVRDVSVRMQTERQLRQQRERLHNLLNSIEGIVWEAEHDPPKFTYVSRQAERLLGYPLAEWLGSKDFWFGHIHPHDRERVMSHCRSATASGHDHVLEYRMLAADGREVWLRDLVTVVSEPGQVPQLRGVMVDITEARQMAQQLQASEARYRALYENMSEALVLGDSEGRVLDANPAACRLFGCTREQLTQLWLQQLMDEATPAVQAAFDLEHHPGYARLETTARRCDGSVFPVEISTVVFEGHPEQGLVSILFRDVSSQRREAEIRQEEAHRFRSMIQNSSDLVALLDAKGRYLYLTPSMETLLGYRAEVWVGHPATALLHPEDVPTLTQALLGLAPEQTALLPAFRAQARDGTWHWFESWATHKLDDPAFSAYIFNAHDITQHKLQEAQLREALERIEIQEKRLKAVIEHMGEGVAMVDGGNDFYALNEAAARILAVPLQEPIFLDWERAEQRAFRPDRKTLLPAHEHPLYRVLQGENFATAEMHYRAPGSEGVDLLLTATPLPGEGPLQRAVVVFHDVTELRRAEERARATRDRLEYVLQRLTYGFFTLNQDWQVTFANPASQLYAQDHSLDTLRSHSFWDLFPLARELQLKFYTEYQRAMSEQVNVHFQEYSPQVDAWVEVDAYPFGDELNVFFRDITETYRNEQVLQLEKEMLAAVALPQQPLEKVLSDALKGFEAIFSRRQVALIKVGEMVADLPPHIAPTLSEASVCPLQQVPLQDWLALFAHTEMPVCALESLCLQGIEACFEHHSTLRFLPVRSRAGRLLAICVVFYQQSAWVHRQGEQRFLGRLALLFQMLIQTKEDEWALRLSNERYDFATRATSDVIWDLSLADRRIVFNNMMSEIFGWQDAQLETHISWWEERVHPEDQVRVLASLRGALQGQYPYWNEEYRFRCADGSWRYVRDRGYILHNSAGEPVRLIGSMQDITRLKQHEIQVMNQNQRLKDIAWLQSHQVRRPLANMMGLLQLLELELPPTELLGHLRREADELDRIIHDVVNKAREALGVELGS